MPTPWVATHSDLALSGLPPSACVPDAREIQGVDLTTGIWELDGHGFDGGEFVRYVALPGNTIPAGISRLTYYTVAPTNGNPDFFQLSPLLIPSDAGSGTISLVENVIPKIDRVMAQWTSELIANATYLAPPWYTPPTWGPMLVAKLAAPTIANMLRIPSARYDVAMIADGFAWAKDRLALLRAGETFDDGIGPIGATSAETYNAAIAGNDSVADAPGATLWRTGTL